MKIEKNSIPANICFSKKKKCYVIISSIKKLEAAVYNCILQHYTLHQQVGCLCNKSEILTF